MTPVDIDKLKELQRLLSDGEWWQTVTRGPNPTSFTSDMTHVARQAAALIAKAERVDALDWLSGQTRLELHHYSPVYGDDDDQSVEWRVTEVSGPINDREWTTVGRGETALDAILSARNAISPKPEISDPTKRMEKILGATFTRKATP